MTPFELAEPTSLAAAIQLLERDNPAIRPAGGCTALMLMMKAGVFRPEKLVSLRKVERKYFDISASAEGLRIGAMTTLGRMERSPDVRMHSLLVSRTLVTLSNTRVRNVATIGGALAHGDPHMDLPPVLIALGATVTVVGPTGERHLDAEDLLTGYYETAIENNELIGEVQIPSQGSKKAWYSKVTTGSADDWPALGIAAVLDCANDEIRSARIVASGATHKATRLKSAEAILAGKSVNKALLMQAGEAALGDCELIEDVRGSIPYKKELMRIYVRRTVQSALKQSADLS